MKRRILALTIIAVGVVATLAASYAYISVISPLNSTPKPSSSPATIIHIPKGSSIHPTGFSSSYFQQNFPTGNYPYLVSIKVKIGLNNTIEWVNDDSEGHTVTALVAPSDAAKFNSGLIDPTKTFTVTLTVTGVYRYTCAWHNWLAGQITVS